VLIPLCSLVLRAASSPSGRLWHLATADPRVLASYRLSFGASFAAASVATVLGGIVAWVLVRYRFPGRGLLDGVVDLPFALPTAVSGIALTTVYSRNGIFGQWLEAHGVKVAFTPLGITIALIFVGLPFAVRSLQTAVEDISSEVEEASATLGARRSQTLARVVIPSLLPSVFTGFSLAFARALGEYGSVVFISGNMPGRTEIAPLLIVTRLEQYDYDGAAAIALVLMVFSLATLVAINLLQRWTSTSKEAAS
jgi:sulfate/thiosulfate transport system permease protein